MCTRQLFYRLSSVAAGWIILLAGTAVAQTGLADVNEILRRVQTQSGVEINLGSGGNVEVKVPKNDRRASSPFSRSGNATLRSGNTNRSDDDSNPSVRPQATLPPEISRLLESLVPEIRSRRTGMTTEQTHASVDTRDGFAVELETPQGRIVVNQQGVASYGEAVRAFKQRRYESAVGLADRAVDAMPGMKKFVQFRGLARFANGQFAAAAEDVYQALDGGPAFDWLTVEGFYASPDDYAARYGELQRAAARNPESVELQFLVAYHHTLLGHYDAAISAWERADRLLPKDPIITAQIRKLQQRPKPLTSH